jgi:translation initiation factor 1 (eIF-1/SUI1)
LYLSDALSKKLGTLSVEAQSKLEQDTAKKEKKAEAKADAEAKKKQASRVTIKRIERNKKKYVTAIHGLEAFGQFICSLSKLWSTCDWFWCPLHYDLATLPLGIDLKKAAKQFATKFATGASVSKNAQGLDEIVVQGDVTDEIVEMLEGNVGVLKGVPEDNIVCIEDKKKKGGAE